MTVRGRIIPLRRDRAGNRPSRAARCDRKLMRSPSSGTARPHRASKIGTSNNGTLREVYPRSCFATLKHDPEKWEPVFGKRSCSNKELERDDDSKKNHPALE